MADHNTNNQHMVEEVHQPVPEHPDQGNLFFSLDPGLSLWVWIVFFAFIFLLWKFGYKPVSNLLGERKKSIKQSLDDAEAARQSLKDATERQRQLIEEGHSRAAEIIEKAGESAERLANSIREKAREESDKMVENARVQIERQKERAVSELKSEVANLAVSVASELIKANLDDDVNHKLVEDFIKSDQNLLFDKEHMPLS
jgi:F-type H+-transporting ATPase subunit b